MVFQTYESSTHVYILPLFLLKMLKIYFFHAIQYTYLIHKIFYYT